MTKIFAIGIIVFILWYLFSQKFSKLKFNTENVNQTHEQIIQLNIPTFLLRQVLKKVLISVATGVFLLLIVLIIASRFKIILIILPLCFYLIGQFFIFQNHVNIIKRQKATYTPLSNLLTVTTGSGKQIKLAVENKTCKVKEIKPVQRNNGLSLGYFELSTNEGRCYIPYLLSKNQHTLPLFNAIEKLTKEEEIKIFPII